ncbi:MAG: A/G-specific adenine glycosylase [Proteobacteria bacterium]|nr:A/G-specific adenine glycosylase [Pseudomonadota bacterium]
MIAGFSEKIIDWQKLQGRHDLPWQLTSDPYPIWVSEIMLQQTQVSTVIPYFNRFLSVFPDLRTLAHAHIDSVLAQWSGLGYYTRARKLHCAAITIMSEHAGIFPESSEAIQRLPGIGRTTAAAIRVFAFGAKDAILDGNVRRVLMRYFALEGPTSGKRAENTLWPLAERLLPDEEIVAYTQGLMDLGATCCSPRQPACFRCPLRQGCKAFEQGRVQDFPAPPPSRKALPERQIIMLLIGRNERLLFQRQPEKGLWGGLYVLPYLADMEEAQNFLSSHFGADLSSGRWLESVKHGLTHFRLVIRPWQIVLKPSDLFLEQQVWWKPDEALAQGLPVPVRRLVSTWVPG